MARSTYGRSTRGRGGRSTARKPAGRTARSRSFAPRATGRALRSAKRGRGQELRIVVEQVTASPVSRPIEGLMRTFAKTLPSVPKKAKF